MRYPWFWAFMGATFAWVAIGIWLSTAIDWPAGYGFRCSGRACLYVELWHSPTLIGAGHRHLVEVLEFLWLWSLPLAGVVLFIAMQRKARRDRRSSPNAPE